MEWGGEERTLGVGARSRVLVGLAAVVVRHVDWVCNSDERRRVETEMEGVLFCLFGVGGGVGKVLGRRWNLGGERKRGKRGRAHVGRNLAADRGLGWSWCSRGMTTGDDKSARC